MLKDEEILSSVGEARDFIGERRIWEIIPNKFYVVRCWSIGVHININEDHAQESISVGPQIWCKYTDDRGREDTVWFAKQKFLKLQKAEASDEHNS